MILMIFKKLGLEQSIPYALMRGKFSKHFFSIRITIIQNKDTIIGNLILKLTEDQLYICLEKSAEFYGVETKALRRSVRRNLHSFPEDFMFEMDEEELKNWRYQFGTSNSVKIGLSETTFRFH